MKRRAVILGLAATGCAPRGAFTAVSRDDPDRLLQPIYLADTRSGQLALARLEVSLPRNRPAGRVSYDGEDRFAIAASTPIGADIFATRLAGERPADAPVSIFVHGYNNRPAEAVYRHAQMAQDIGRAGPHLTFSWPSISTALGYVADRDAALRSRDPLERLLLGLARDQPRRIVLIGHSMGGLLVMETLRQMALRGVTLGDRLEGLVLISPDIDIDLFRSQAEAIGTLPQPFVVTISERDRALGLSARLAGRRARLGAPDDLTRLRDLDLTVIDFSAARGGTAGNHLQAVSSPDAIRWLDVIGRSAIGRDERSGFRFILPG